MSQTDYEQSKPNDNLLQSTIGNFGRWQFRISILMALLKFPIAWFQLSIVFLAPPTQFWCKPSPSSNLTLTDLEIIRLNKNILPRHEGLNTGFCQMMDYKNHPNNATINCINGYEYNRTVFHSSIITEWDLVCANKRFVDISQIILMLGILIGNVAFGISADRYGRKSTLMIGICLQSVFGILAAWIPWFWGFIFLRFLLAVANGGVTVISFVMCMEVVGGNWRTIIPILYQIPFAFGNSIMAGLAYFLRDWRDLQFAISLLSAVYVLYFWFVPESPRWLLAVGRKNEAIAVLQNAAKCNNLDLDPGKIEQTIKNLQKKDTDFNTQPVSILFSMKELKKRCILLCINWLIVGITFFAFSQYPGKIAQNIHFTVAIGGFVALPGTLFCVYVTNRYGRRWTIAAAHFLTAICFLAIHTVPSGVYVQDWPRILFAGIGIVGLSISMPALHLFTGELFPTTLRNAGVGTTVMFSRIGAMIAPLVIAMEDLLTFLPLLILGIMAIIEALLVLFLPETKGVILPDTVNDLKTNNNQPLRTMKGSYVSLSKQQNEED